MSNSITLAGIGNNVDRNNQSEYIPLKRRKKRECSSGNPHPIAMRIFIAHRFHSMAEWWQLYNTRNGKSASRLLPVSYPLGRQILAIQTL